MTQHFLSALTLLGLIPVVGSWAQAAPPASVHQALLAQVVGMGGCNEIDSVSTKVVRFFPRVRFWEGTCSLEHGDIAKPLAASDNAGLVYVLDSESGFAFLTRQHPPVGLDSSSVIEYVKQALIMQGKLSPDVTFLRDRASAPRKLCQITGLECGGLFLPRVEHNGRAVYLTAFTEWAIYSAGPIVVNLETGAVTAVVEKRSKDGRRLR